MFSTKKTQEHPSRASSWPTEAADAAAVAAVAAAEGAAGAAEAAAVAADAGAVAAADAVCRGEVVASARPKRFATTWTDAGRCGRVRSARRLVVCGAVRVSACGRGRQLIHKQ